MVPNITAPPLASSTARSRPSTEATSQGFSTVFESLDRSTHPDIDTGASESDGMSSKVPKDAEPEETPPSERDVDLEGTGEKIDVAIPPDLENITTVTSQQSQRSPESKGASSHPEPSWGERSIGTAGEALTDLSTFQNHGIGVTLDSAQAGSPDQGWFPEGHDRNGLHEAASPGRRAEAISKSEFGAVDGPPENGQEASDLRQARLAREISTAATTVSAGTQTSPQQSLLGTADLIQDTSVPLSVKVDRPDALARVTFDDAKSWPISGSPNRPFRLAGVEIDPPVGSEPGVGKASAMTGVTGAVSVSGAHIGRAELNLDSAPEGIAEAVRQPRIESLQGSSAQPHSGSARYMVQGSKNPTASSGEQGAERFIQPEPDLATRPSLQKMQRASVTVAAPANTRPDQLTPAGVEIVGKSSIQARAVQPDASGELLAHDLRPLSAPSDGKTASVTTGVPVSPTLHKLQTLQTGTEAQSAPKYGQAAHAPTITPALNEQQITQSAIPGKSAESTGSRSLLSQGDPRKRMDLPFPGASKMRAPSENVARAANTAQWGGSATAPSTVPSAGGIMRRTAEAPFGKIVGAALKTIDSTTQNDKFESPPLTDSGNLPPLFAENRGGAIPTAHAGTFSPLRSEHAAAVIRQMMEVSGQLQDGPVDLRLNPDELGRVRMHMVTSDQAIVMHITSERPETLDLLRRHIDQLHRELSDLGYSRVDFTFGQQGREAGGGAGQSAARSGQSSGDQPQEAAGGSASSSPIPIPRDRLDIRL